MKSFEKLNTDNAKCTYIEFVGPLVIMIEAPVILLTLTWGTSKLFLSKGMLEEI